MLSTLRSKNIPAQHLHVEAAVAAAAMMSGWPPKTLKNRLDGV